MYTRAITTSVPRTENPFRPTLHRVLPAAPAPDRATQNAPPPTPYTAHQSRIIRLPIAEFRLVADGNQILECYDEVLCAIHYFHVT